MFVKNIYDNRRIDMSEKIIQFGEGGFLRGFADWMIKK